MRSGSAVWIAWVAVGCLAAVMSGCGRDGPERIVVSGTVTFRSEPVKTGEIRFIPTKGTEGPAEGTLIVDGQYLASGKGGVPVGTYTVSIVAWHGWAPRRDMPSPNVPLGRQDNDPSRKQLLPAKYNSQSQLAITVKPGSGKLVQDFILTD
jgi:hypothetical protein